MLTCSSQNYKLVVKQFDRDRSVHFHDEKRIFEIIRNSQGRQGIIQYFGWYENRMINPATKDIQTFHNLVLERGTQDLYSVFQNENPSTTHIEIQEFWTSLFDVAEALASIQKLNEPDWVTSYYV